jgi:RNA polymerase sigma-70 factor (ECF subfamily)
MIEVSEGIAFQEPALTQDGEARTCNDRFTALVMRQSRFAFRVAYSVLRNAHDAEDVVQETFLKLYRSGRWQHIIDERAFLARATWRMAVDRRPRIQPEPARDEIRATASDPEAAAISADWNATVSRLIDALPEELRQPLALSALDDLTSHQIGEIIGVADATVRTRLMRARQILKQKLAALGRAHHES